MASPRRPSLPQTPESYSSGLRRKDSKNALTTCHGITTTGRACRRPIAKARSAIGARDFATSGSFVIPQAGEDPAVFFCHQHKEQAELLVGRDGEGSVVEVGTGRRSLEGVFRELRLEEVDEEESDDDEAQSGRDLGDGSSDDESSRASTPIAKPSFQSHRGPREPTRFYPGEQTTDSQPLPRDPEFRRRSGRDERPHDRSLQRKSIPKPLSYQAQPMLAEPLVDTPQDRERRRRRRKSKPEKPPSPWSTMFGCFSSNDLEQEPIPSRSSRPSTKPQTLEIPSPRPAGEGDEQRSPRRRRQSVPQARESRDSHNSQQRRQRRSSPTPVMPARHSEGQVQRDSSSKHRSKKPSRPREANDWPPSPRRTAEDMASGSPADARPKSHRHRRKSSGARDPARRSLPDQRPQITVVQAAKPDPFDETWIPDMPRSASNSARLVYAKLLTAMSEPPTRSDAPGYIYIFWQTEDGASPTEAETSAAASVIASSPSRGGELQREEAVLQRRFFQPSDTPSIMDERRTLFLKIGRAANVHQRLAQWRRQCEYDISLLRYYPYDPAAGEGGVVGSEASRKVAYVGKVEKLIHLHLEMLGQRVRKRCRCGAEHREWFEVEASVKGVKEVDAIVRDWIRWSEGRFGREV